MNRLHAALVTFCLLLTACGSVPPAPTDRYYRLQPVSVAPVGKTLAGAIYVHPFRADSLYAERPIVYSEEASLRQLRQYHYHLWLYPPAQLVQNHLAASLGKTLDLSGSSNSSNGLEGRLVDFERVLSGKASKAVVTLELRLIASGKQGLSKTYHAEQVAADETMGAFVVATEQALSRIYADFLTDLARSQ